VDDSLKSICYLNPAGNRFVDVDHSAIIQYPNVPVLDLLNDRIAPISNLGGLSPLVVLEISGDRTRSLAFLNQFPSLKLLIAVANRIRLVNLFDDLPNVLSLDTNGNLLTNRQFCLRLPNRKYICVDGCGPLSLTGIESLHSLRGISCPENSLE
jgi:Leucine-rich repeat (LRR) protein